ncbi:MAG: UDP-N-acetylmuramoyl-L-alanine--D-glutamate ligase [bacterium]|nr:UDP-N-acetylmuramoyl-L-alanine--D-glutamate ligase [bacterium]
MQIVGARVLVVGMGLSGLAAVELLYSKGAIVTAADLRGRDELPAAAEQLDGWDVPLVQQSSEAFAGQELVVLSPGVPADLDLAEGARSRGIQVIGEVELASYYIEGGIIGITGSNGKTTTTALTGHILSECGLPVQVGGNIGNPPTKMVATSRPGQWNVLELSSFQLETIEQFRAGIAVALNVTQDHLDRHHTMEAYAAAKQRLFETQNPEDHAVLNADDPYCLVYGGLKERPVWFSSLRAVTPGLWLDGERIVFDGETLMKTDEVRLRGRHNLENVMAAAAAARLAGAEMEPIAAAIRTFPGVEHRLEFVTAINGVRFFNDSKATNVDATRKAIEAFDGHLWVILGGKDKGSDYTELGEALTGRALGALLIGAAAERISEHLGGAVAKIDCGTLSVAVEEAWRRASPGDTILLAPACASFDQFRSYEHRGQVFKEIVRDLRGSQCV